MVTWTNKHWGALIGFVILLVIAWLGFGAAALAVIGGVVGYFVGSFLDGELDLSDIQRRTQRRG
ncbi:MAG: hypothetical protein LC781_17715 [Actinobacteria bacterium]|nr:hypothetical protein [Actinomycetota bacterium]